MLKRILSILSSLRLTVILLSLSMLLIYAGTWAQVDYSIQTVQERFFHSGVAWIFPTSFPHAQFSERLSGLLPGHPHIPGGFPMPGGYTMGVLLMINLVSAYVSRFKFTARDLLVVPAVALMIVTGHLVYPLLIHTWGYYVLVAAILVSSIPLVWMLYAFHGKRCGVLLIHLAILSLIVSEGLTSGLKVESYMQLAEGETTNYAIDPSTIEVAVVDPSPVDHDQVATISKKRLLSKAPISDPRLPFEVKLVAYYNNSELLGPMQPKPPGVLKPTAGYRAQQGVTVVETPDVSGVAGMGGERASAFVAVSHAGRDLGTYLLSVYNGQSDDVTVDGKTYELSLRPTRLYKPYTVTLKKFKFDRYLGSEMARNFSSDIRLVDAANQVDREVRIWMNHPLRYGGDTIFQADFDHKTEKGTVLEVVGNPSWTLPYVSLGIGSIGLIIHFGLTLFNFLRKRAKVAGFGGTEAGVSGGLGAMVAFVFRTKARREREAAQAAAASWTYSLGVNVPKKGAAAKPAVPVRPLAPEAPSTPFDWLVPLGVTAVFAIYLLTMLVMPASTPPNSFNLTNFGKLPVVFDGRTLPYDSLARNTMKVLAGRETFVIEGDKAKKIPDEKAPAIRWLAEVLCDPQKAADLKVFRIDQRELADRFSKKADANYFSLNEILPQWDTLQEQFERLPDDVEKKGDLYQRKLAELRMKLRIYFRTGGVFSASWYPLFEVKSPRLREFLRVKPDQKRVSFDELWPAMAQLEPMRRELAEIPARERTPEQSEFMRPLDSVLAFASLLSRDTVFIVPPLKEGEEWMTMQKAAELVRNKAAAPEGAKSVGKIEQAYEAHQVDDFNREVAAYQRLVDQKLATVATKAKFESSFNRFDPFTTSIVMYVVAFVLVCFSWLGFNRPLSRAAFWLVLLTFLVHTAGLVARVYISGRPPVTNLEASPIFIGWAMVIFGMGLELVFRSGIGLTLSTVAGGITLLMADRLGVSAGDTMKVVVAVLDTNLWLATHVVAVSIGYASTYVAGMLGIAYLVMGLFARTLDKETGKTVSKMIYGIACFSLLFSFIGTVLGGIWADQSWGRFWGWDSKENGAVLVVLCNAILLHARWSGLARDRGIAMLSIFGMIVTSWSYFGTNLLGVGLHAYGFMEGGPYRLLAVCGTFLLLIIVGMSVPWKYWSTSREAEVAQ